MGIVKLREESMGQVLGGAITQDDVGTDMFLCGAVIAALGAVGGLGSGVTSLVYCAKKSWALKKGDSESPKKYGKVARATGIAAASCGGALVVGAALALSGFGLVWDAAGKHVN